MGKAKKNGVNNIMFKHKLIRALEQAITEVQKRGLLAPSTLPELTVEHPQNSTHGDYASSCPLKLARISEMPPLAIAENIV